MSSQPLPALFGSVSAGVAGTVAIQTHGCKLNQADSALLAQEFAAAGYRLVADHRDADIIVVNTCTVTATADAKARQTLRAARRANPDAVVVAAGCYPERAAADLRRMPEVSLVVGNRDKQSLSAMAIAESRRAGAAATPARAQPAPRDGGGMIRRSRAMVKIQEGCDQVCAYCIVPKVRGRERSIPPEQLAASVQLQVARGFREVTLTGTQLGTYGFDLPDLDLPRLIDRILAVPGLQRLRVSSLQAHEISPDLLLRWNDDRLCPHFHVPLQSGSDATLRAMRRRYDTATYRTAVDQIRALVPDAGITTDIIVGFPGESDANHAESLALVERVGFSDVHVFPYSRRPGTTAHHLSGQVDATRKRRRAAEMAAVAEAGFVAYRNGLVGQTRKVLWETRRTGPAGVPVWSGLTDNYVRVAAPSDADLARRITGARLVKLDGKAVLAELPPA